MCLKKVLTSKSRDETEKGFYFLFLNSPETSRLVPTYSLVQWESQSSVVPLKNVLVGCVDFRKKNDALDILNV